MERFAWRAHIKPDTIGSMKKAQCTLARDAAVLNDAGIHNLHHLECG